MASGRLVVMYFLVAGPFAAIAALGGIMNALFQAAEQGYFAGGLWFLTADLVRRHVSGDVAFALLVAALLLPVPLILQRTRYGPWVALPFLYVTGIGALTARLVYPGDWQTSLLVKQLPIAVPVIFSRSQRLAELCAVVLAFFLLFALVAAVRARSMQRSKWSPSARLAVGCRNALATSLAVAGVALVLPGAATPADPERPFNVIWLTIDSVRADHLSAYGYDRPTSPNLEAFAREAVLFERSLTQHNWTRPSYASMITGRAAWEFEDRRLGPLQMTLAEILKHHGYRTIAYVQNPNLAAELNFDQGFDFYRRVSARVEASRVNAFVLDRIDELTGSEQPFFLFVHWIGPHWPYSTDNPYVPSFLRTTEHAVPPERISELMEHHGTDWDLEAPEAAGQVSYLRDLYDASIRLADERLGEVLSALKRTRLWDRSLIIVNSDHGDEFAERGGFGHAHGNVHPELTHVPFVIRFPADLGVEPRRVSSIVRGLDLAPTALAALGIETPPQMTGRSLLPLETLDGEERLAVSHARGKLAVRKGGRALVMDLDDLTATSYDVDRDPLEHDPISSRDEDPRHLELRAAADTWLEEFGPSLSDASTKSQVSPELADRLRALGYVE